MTTIYISFILFLLPQGTGFSVHYGSSDSAEAVLKLF